MSVLDQIPSIPIMALSQLMNVVEEVGNVYAKEGYDAAVAKSESYPDMDSRVMATKAILAAQAGFDAGYEGGVDHGYGKGLEDGKKEAALGAEDAIERLRRLA